MNWYDTQLFGVIVGAILGFLSSYLPRLIDTKKKKKSIANALAIEIHTIASYWQSRIEIYSNYLQTLKAGGPCSIYYAQERDPDVIFKSNAGNLEYLSHELVDKIVDFYNNVGMLHSRIKALQDAFNNHNEKSDPTLDNQFLSDSMQKAIIMMQSLVSDGNKLSNALKT